MAIAVGGAAARTATPVLGFDGYGAVRLGDTPAEVKEKLGLPLQCNYLGGPCVCAVTGEGRSSLVFAFQLDPDVGLDLIFTSSGQVEASRGLRVGDSIARMKELFPHAHETRRGGYSGYRRFIVSSGPRGILAEFRRGNVIELMAGKKRFFDYLEFCS